MLTGVNKCAIDVNNQATVDGRLRDNRDIGAQCEHGVFIYL